MTKKEVVEILKGMDCEIAEVQIRFAYNGKVRHGNVLVYLVSEPSNKDKIIIGYHWWIFNNIDEFDNNITEIFKDITNETSTQIDFNMVSGFISDFETDEVKEQTDEEKTIQWYKVKCSNVLKRNLVYDFGKT